MTWGPSNSCYRGPHLRLRVRGWRYCAWSIAKATDEPYESPTARHSHNKRDDQCRQIVSPKEMKRNDGMPICPNHLKAYRAAMDEAAQVRQALRDKYDPGPLPVDENA